MALTQTPEEGLKVSNAPADDVANNRAPDWYLNSVGISTSDFAGFIKTDAPVQLYNERDEAQNRIPSGKAIGDVKLAAHTDYGLRYGEFIGPLIKAVQELSAKVTALESA